LIDTEHTGPTGPVTFDEIQKLIAKAPVPVKHCKLDAVPTCCQDQLVARSYIRSADTTYFIVPRTRTN